MRVLTYYAIALNPAGKIGQLLVTREMGDAPGQRISSRQEWTGVTYKSNRAAADDIARLNRGCKPVAAKSENPSNR